MPRCAGSSYFFSGFVCWLRALGSLEFVLDLERYRDHSAGCVGAFGGLG